MQYCTKCKHLTEDLSTVCPFCKRSRSLRVAKNGDMVLLMKTTEFEASELGQLFEENGVIFTIEPFSMGMVSSLYDSQVMPTDKTVFVAFESLLLAKSLLAREESQEPEPEPEPPTAKRLAIQIGSVILFLLLVAGVAMGADAAFAAISGWFTGGNP